MENVLEKKIRERFAFPDDVPTNWGIVVENVGGETRCRPALAFNCGENAAFVDIMHDEIKTPRNVSRMEVKIIPAEAIVDGDVVMLSSFEGGYRVTLFGTALEGLYFNKTFSPELAERIASGEVVF